MCTQVKQFCFCWWPIIFKVSDQSTKYYSMLLITCNWFYVSAQRYIWIVVGLKIFKQSPNQIVTWNVCLTRDSLTPLNSREYIRKIISLIVQGQVWLYYSQTLKKQLIFLFRLQLLWFKQLRTNIHDLYDLSIITLFTTYTLISMLL